jgi:hypothetical protein
MGCSARDWRWQVLVAIFATGIDRLAEFPKELASSPDLATAPIYPTEVIVLRDAE